jgi:deoxyhypusine synthase
VHQYEETRIRSFCISYRAYAQDAVKITVADVRDGACSSSTLKEASSWGKVNASEGFEQIVYAEATSVLPLIISYVYHKGG